MTIMQRGATCPRCHQGYTVKFRDSSRFSHTPLVLKCGHTFCENCCNKMAKEGDHKIICSFCQMDFTLLPGEMPAKILSPNYYLIGLIVFSQKQLLTQELSRLVPSGFTHVTRKNIQKKDRFNKGGPICYECGINTATCQCKKCDCLMCGLCFDKVHSSSNTLKQHQAISIKIEDGFQENISPKCPIHDTRPIEYFCEDDKTAICSRCVIIGDHKGHSITSMEERNKLVIADMEPALNTATQVWKHLKKTEKSLVDALPNIKDETSSVIEEIKSHFSLLHGALQARENMLIQEVFALFGSGFSPIEEMKMDLQEEKIKLEAAIRAANKIMKNTDDVVVNAKEILDHLMKAQELPCVFSKRNPTTEDGIRWEADSSMIGEIMTHGSVGGSVPQRVVVQPLSDVPGNVILDDDIDTASIFSADSSACTEATSAESDVIIEGDSDSLAEEVPLVSKKRHKTKASKESKKDSPSKLGKAKLQGHCEQVTVTHIKSPVKFYVQRVSDKKKLSQLSKAMNTWCNGLATDKDRPIDVKAGEAVLGKYTDDNRWYRCVVKGVMITTEMDGEETRVKTNVEVLYMDFGNAEVLPIEKLYTMQPRFMKNPEFVLECSLYDILPADKDGIWSNEALQTFLKMTEDKPMLMTVVHEIANVLHVDLHKPQGETDLDDRPISVRDCLVFLELAKFATSTATKVTLFPSYTKREYMTAEPIGVGETFYGMVTNLDLPSSFHVQPAGDELNYLCNLMADMQTTYTSKGDLYSVFCPQIGMVCVSQYSVDQYWYRAVVVGLPGGRQVDVMYVDFGIQERVSYLKIRKILDAHLKLPPLAVHCELGDVEPASPDGTWGDEGRTWWADAVNLKKFQLKVVEVQDNKLSVVLYEVDPVDLTIQELSINYCLVKSGIGKSTGKWSHAISPEKMTVTERPSPDFRLYEKTEAKVYEEVMKADSETSKSFFSIQPISVSPSKLHPKSVADRSSVDPETDSVDIPGDTVDCAVSDSSRPVTMGAENMPGTPPTNDLTTDGDICNDQLLTSSGHTELHSPPRQVVQSSPTRISDSENENQCSVDSDQSAQTEGKDPVVIVDSLPKKETKSYHSEKQKEKEILKRDTNEPKPNVDDKGTKKKKSSDIHIEIVVTQFSSPADFSVQISHSGNEDLNEMMGKLQLQFMNSEPPLIQWKKNDFCVVKYAKDNRWYRSKILDVVKEDLYKVYYVDYGFVETVPGSELRALGNHERNMPCKALCCCLADVISAGSGDPTKWSQTACEHMQDIIKDKTLYIKQKADVIDGDIPKLPVDILIEEDVIETALEPARKKVYSLIQNMKDSGLAIPWKRPKTPKKVQPDATTVPSVRTYKPHPVPLVSAVNVIPTYVDYSGVVYSQLVDEESILQNLIDELQKQYAKSMSPNVQWQIDQACVAFFKSDNLWYRARVTKIIDNKVQIQYLDYGNSEILDPAELRLPTDSFLEIPQMCLECVFYNLKSASDDGKWQTVVLEYIHNTIVNNNITLKIMKVEENGQLEVIVFLSDGIDFCQVLVQNGVAVTSEGMEGLHDLSNKISDILEKKNPFKTVNLLPEGVSFPVSVTHVELPHVIYMQHVKQDSAILCDKLSDELITSFNEINNGLDQLFQMAQDLQLAIPSAKKFTSLPGPGQMCCTKFSCDNCWYRGLVIDTDETSQGAFVLYVDYGNAEYVSLDRLRVLSPELRTLPAQAMRCKLTDLQPPAGESQWTTASLKAMFNAVGSKVLMACIKNLTLPTVEIDLLEPIGPDQNVMKKAYQSLLDQGLAQLANESVH
ncbi:RING finger protein 17-like isoform X2 [Gigantopelta aegis]|uniref:RING finger protein 17-like isoform X2 n=1 Tax=Gigantopelta aegis TaxID=1735272 RepID=UPI001B88CDA2|nr:RING finger protein 17-like isoform X2 [Gigantopelta aegis]